MDYESRVQLLEKEAAHLSDLLQIARRSADVRLEHIQEITLSLARTVDKLAATVNTLTEKVDALADKVDALVEALLRQNPNNY